MNPPNPSKAEAMLEKLNQDKERVRRAIAREIQLNTRARQRCCFILGEAIADDSNLREKIAPLLPEKLRQAMIEYVQKGERIRTLREERPK